MRADRLTVDEDLREVVARAEAQDGAPPAGQVRAVEGRAIPGDAHVVAQVCELRVPRKPDARDAPAARAAEIGRSERRVFINEELPPAFELERLRARARRQQQREQAAQRRRA